MFAHRIVGFTGPDAVEWVETVEPTAAAGESVIDVAAAGVSFADLLQTQGRYQLKPALPFTPGMDAVGTLRTPRPDRGFAAGQRVAVLTSYGCWQQIVSAPVERLLPLPDDMSFEVAAAFALNYLTGLFALERRGAAGSGETALVHGAAGGVGIAAVQLARALGLRTIAVVSDEAKRQFALRFGAHDAVLLEGWADAVRGLVGERAVDIVVDPVGGDRITDSLRLLAPDGRLLVLGFTAGDIPTVKVNRLLLGNTAVVGVGSREFLQNRPELMTEMWGRLTDLRRTGALREPPVEVRPFEDARGALNAIADRRAMGKIVLSRHASLGE